jgi:hypothetical protein
MRVDGADGHLQTDWDRPPPPHEFQRGIHGAAPTVSCGIPVRLPSTLQYHPMCNPCSRTTTEEAIQRLFRVDVDNTVNLPPLPGIYPDYAAPTVRNSAAGRDLDMARWEMPTPRKFLEGRKYDPGVTDGRNVKFSH